MAEARPQVPGIERGFSVAPFEDPAKSLAGLAGQPVSPRPLWTAESLDLWGHNLSVNVATGALTITCVDGAMPYYDIGLRATRVLDVAQQHMMQSVLRMHPNSDPTYHLFGNWQLSREAHAAPAWDDTYAELIVADGSGQAAVFYQDGPTFEINGASEESAKQALRSYGIPLRTLEAIGWAFEPGDDLLRTRQRGFSVATGKHHPATLVDAPETRLWIFDPVSGVAVRYTSSFYYRNVQGVDGSREVGQPLVADLVVDALGHFTTFAPIEEKPPYRTYLMRDGSGRELAFELEAFASYLDGDRPGGTVQSFFSSRLIDKTKNADNVTHFAYENGLLVRVSSPSLGPQRQLTYIYNSLNNLEAIEDVDSNRITVEYIEDLLDSDERLIPRLKVSRITDPEGAYVSYNYNHPAGEVNVTFGSPSGETSNLTYRYKEDISDSKQRYVIEQEVKISKGVPLPETITSKYFFSTDGHFNPVEVRNPLGHVVRHEYNEYNQLTAVVDPLNHRKEYIYDLSAFPTAHNPHRYDLLHTQEVNIDAASSIFDVTVKASYERYDSDTTSFPEDSLLSTHRLAEVEDETGSAWTYAYDDLAEGSPLEPTVARDPMGEETFARYDNTGAVTEVEDALGQLSLYRYGPNGQLHQVTDPNGFLNSWQYDQASDWVQAATDALGFAPGDPAHSVTVERDRHGRVVKETDAVGDVTEYSYLRNGRLSHITRFEPSPQMTGFTFDPQGRVTRIVDPEGGTSTFEYDEAGRLVTAGRPSVTAQTFRYNAASSLIEFTDRDGAITTYTYDAAGRVRTTKEPDWSTPNGPRAGKTVLFTYDHLGRRLSMSDSDFPNPFLYAYDAAGRLTARTDPWGHTIEYRYDLCGRLSRIFDSGHLDIQYVLDALGRTDRVIDSGYQDPSETFQYDYVDGPLKNRLFQLSATSVKLAHQFKYDANDMVTNVEHLRNGVTLSDFGYVLRSDQRISQFTGDRIGSLDYDGVKQIVVETDMGKLSAYDPRGNRSWRAGAAPANVQSFDSNCRLLHSPQLGEDFTYNANGSLTRRSITGGGPETSFTYDGVDRLVRLDHDDDVVEYLYDPDGMLLERKQTSAVGGAGTVIRYRYAGRNIVSAVDAAGNTLELYTVDPAGRRLRRRDAVPVPNTSGSHSLYYLHDGLNNVVALVDALGARRVRADYDVWGEGTPTDPDGLAGHFGYRSAYTDPTSHLVHFGLRWYAPDLGRWMSEDPLLPALAYKGGGSIEQAFEELTNLYCYVGNDPANELDPFGLGKGKVVIRVLRWIRGGGGRARLGRPGKVVSEAQAARIVEQGGHVGVAGPARSSQLTARRIAESASERGRVVHDAPHGPGQSSHYHPVGAKGRGAGHVLYSVTSYLTVEHYLGDNWFSTAADFVNPLSLPNDIVGIGLELFGDD